MDQATSVSLTFIWQPYVSKYTVRNKDKWYQTNRDLEKRTFPTPSICISTAEIRYRVIIPSTQSLNIMDITACDELFQTRTIFQALYSTSRVSTFCIFPQESSGYAKVIMWTPQDLQHFLQLYLEQGRLINFVLHPRTYSDHDLCSALVSIWPKTYCSRIRSDLLLE